MSLAKASEGGRPSRRPAPTKADELAAAEGLASLGLKEGETAAPGGGGETAPGTDKETIAMDEFGGWALLETTTIKHVGFGELPEHMRHDEKDECYEYSFADVITMGTAGIDHPPRVRSSTNRFFDDTAPVVVTIRDEDEATTPTIRYFGDKVMGKAADALVTMGWHTNSQHPAMVLAIKRDDGKKDVLVHLFTNSFRRYKTEDGNYEIDFDTFIGRSDRHEKAILYAPENVQKHCRDGELVTFGFRLGDMYNSQERPPVGTPPKVPAYVSNISDAELQWIHKEFYSGKVVLKPWQYLVAALAKEHLEITVSRFWAAKDDKLAWQFQKWLTAAQHMVAAWGSHWAYQLQEDRTRPIYNAAEPVTDIQVPRWLVNKWRVKNAEDGTIVEKLGPAEFSKVETHDFYPESGMFPFECKVSIERERGYASDILCSHLTDRKDWTIKACIMADPGHPKVYMVGLSALVKPALIPGDESVKPQQGSRIEIQVQTKQWGRNGGETFTLSGMLCENIFDIPGELCCYVRCRDDDLFRDWPELRAGGHSIEASCVAKFIDDPTPADRYSAAVSQLQDALASSARTKGVDAPHLFVRSLPAIDADKRGSFATELNASLAGKLAFDRVLKRRNLNEMQLEAANNARDSSSGLVAVQGPPGTGKTWMLMATAEAHICAEKAMNARRPTIVCAPSNAAVDNCMTQFLKGLPANGPELVCVRYTSGLAKPPAAASQSSETMDTSTTPQDLRQQRMTEKYSGEADMSEENIAKHATLDAAYWEHVSGRAKFMNNEMHSGYGYHTARTKWEDNVLGKEQHDMREVVLAFREARRDLENASNEEDREDHWVTMKAAENALDAYFLEHVVDVVFCTNSTAAHVGLRRHFEPRVAFIDEAAITTLADPLTPIAFYVQSLEQICLCGDHAQQGPKRHAKKANEYGDIYDKSLLQLIFDNEHLRESRVVLTVQHRMHPELSALVSQIFYPLIQGGLKNHESVRGNEHPKWITMKAFLERMGPAYHGTHRLFIDVSGDKPGAGPVAPADGEAMDESQAAAEMPQIEAIKAANSTSYRNPEEANTAARFMTSACRADVPAGGERIVPSDFLLLSHYGDQVEEMSNHALTAMVAKQLDITEPSHDATVRGCQGGEAPFVLFSATRTHPDVPQDLGFTVDRSSLNVAMSRARLGLFCFGNYAQLVRHMVSGAPWINPNKLGAKAQTVGRILQYAKEHQELVSWEDLEVCLRNDVPTPKEPAITSMIRPDEALRKKYVKGNLKQEAGQKRAAAKTNERGDLLDQYEKSAKIHHSRARLAEKARLKGSAPPKQDDDAPEGGAEGAPEEEEEEEEEEEGAAASSSNKPKGRRRRGKKGGKGNASANNNNNNGGGGGAAATAA